MPLIVFAQPALCVLTPGFRCTTRTASNACEVAMGALAFRSGRAGAGWMLQRVNEQGGGGLYRVLV
jgi:hypothetical protein